MPELPEVETIVRGLSELLIDKEILNIIVSYSGCLKENELELTQKALGRKIINIRRRGKLILIELDQNLVLVFHLKMTGKLLYFDIGQDDFDKHTHIIITFSDFTKIVFNDLRKFGYCLLVTRDELLKWGFYQRLGPEPFEMQAEEFVNRFRPKKTKIKSLLLDQSMLAGIGNIYADEALYLAGIHPASRGIDLDEKELKRLFESLIKVLKQALDLGGTSFRDYVNSLGQPGNYQNNFRVYGRKGNYCKKCATKLESLKVGGRNSVFCPCCQKLI